MDEPRKRFAGMMSGLDIHYDLGEGHPLLGRRMTDLDLVTPNGQLRVFTLLHDARPVLLNLGEPGCFDITPWADRVQSIDAKYVGEWELPALGAVTAPTAVSIRRRSPPCVADQGAGGCQQWQRDGINSATGAFSGVARVQFRHPAGAGGTGWCSSSGICRPIGPVGQRKHSRRHRQGCCRGRDVSSWHCCRTLGKIKAAPGTGARVSLARTEYQMNIRDPEARKRKWPEPKFRPSLNREASRLGDVRVRRPSSRAQVPETCRDQSIASRERWTFERSSTSRNFFWLVCKNCNSLRKLCCVASAEPSFRDFAQ
jgi:hypothetical protein